MISVIEDRNDHLLTENTAVLNWWAEYYKGLYNFMFMTDADVF